MMRGVVMNDPITQQIIQHLKDIPLVKKKALLELIKEDISRISRSNQENYEQWRNSLLTTSVWTDAEIDEIIKAREYIKQKVMDAR
jgi:hypothetical protein